MKRVLWLFLAAVVMWSSAEAQVTVHTPLTPSARGKKKNLRKAPKEIVLSNFSVLFRTTDWAAQGNVGVAAYIEGLSDELVLSIANDAKAYLVKKFEENGYTTTSFGNDELATAKVFKKDIEKGKAEILEGGTYSLKFKKASDGNAYLGVVASGVPVVHWGPDKVQQYGTRSWQLLKERMDLSFDPTFYLIALETGGNSSTNEVTWRQQLAISSGALGNGAYHRHFDKKFKEAGVNLQPLVLVWEGTDWLAESVEKEELYGKSVTYKVDPVKFKAAADATLQVYIDNIVAGLVTTIAAQ